MSAILHQGQLPRHPRGQWQCLETFSVVAACWGGCSYQHLEQAPQQRCWIVRGLTDLVTAGETGAKGSVFGFVSLRCLLDS